MKSLLVVVVLYVTWCIVGCSARHPVDADSACAANSQRRVIMDEIVASFPVRQKDIPSHKGNSTFVVAYDDVDGASRVLYVAWLSRNMFPEPHVDVDHFFDTLDELIFYLNGSGRAFDVWIGDSLMARELGQGFRALNVEERNKVIANVDK